MGDPRLTIIIPTMNRPDFVIRLLDYYAMVGFEHRIAIGDSSNAANVAMTRTALARIGSRLDVAYHEYPGLTCHAAQKALIDSVDTKYIVSLPDDDFLAPTGMNACMEFLDANPDYIAAHGWGFMLIRDPGLAHGVAFGYYPQPIVEAETASQRLLDLFANCLVPAFSVHRTEAFRAMWATEIKGFAFGELLPCCISVIWGKIKQLDCFYLVREIHDRRYLSPDLFDWITAPAWQASYVVFSDTLANELSVVGGVSEGEAANIVKQGFWAYLSGGLTADRPAALAARGSPRGATRRSLMDAVKAAPFIPLSVKFFLQSAWRIRRSRGDMPGMQLELPVLLRPGTRYHDEFMPIYRAVRG